MDAPLRFYTKPPEVVEWPWLFTTMLDWKYVIGKDFECAIVDSGVEYFFLTKRMRDYPRHYLVRYRERAKLLGKMYGDRVWITIPDYPDDYQPGLTHERGLDNVDKTLRNVEEFIVIDGAAWLPVIQSRYMNTFSFLESCERLREIIGDYPRVAIGTVCKARKHSWISYCIKTARAYFPHSWIHAFGLTLRVLSMLRPHAMLSFDSMAWDWYRSYCVGVLERISFDSMAWNYDQLRHYDRAVGDSWRRKAPGIYAKLPARWPSSLRAKTAYFIAYVERISEITGHDYTQYIRLRL
ncbi:MAG: hypothetical protein DRP27_10180 [Thermotogae bacterium]|nr:MAG: hypothetical protein DRP27_10180 [Thermotogota bacterium]